MMTAATAQAILENYQALVTAAKQLAMKKLEALHGDKFRFIKNYLSLESIYMEDGKIHVAFEYQGSYSGQELVILDPQEIAVK